MENFFRFIFVLVDVSVNVIFALVTRPDIREAG